MSLLGRTSLTVAVTSEVDPTATQCRAAVGGPTAIARRLSLL